MAKVPIRNIVADEDVQKVRHGHGEADTVRVTAHPAQQSGARGTHHAHQGPAGNSRCMFLFKSRIDPLPAILLHDIRTPGVTIAYSLYKVFWIKYVFLDHVDHVDNVDIFTLSFPSITYSSPMQRNSSQDLLVCPLTSTDKWSRIESQWFFPRMVPDNS